MDNDRRLEMIPRARNRIMWRPALVFALAAHVALMFCIGTAFAQESGGESVAQELVGTPGALQQIRERAVARPVCAGPRALRCEWAAGERPSCSGGAGLRVEIRPSSGAAVSSSRLDPA